MPACGKSYWAKQIGAKYKTGAYDLDNLIEAVEEKTVSDMFKQDGEEAFRKAETKLLKWFAEKKNFVLATGGGTPCFNNNMDWMNKKGITIWVDEDINVLKERILSQQNLRPLLQHISEQNLAAELQTLLQQRREFYAKAQYHIQGNITLHSFATILKHHA